MPTTTTTLQYNNNNSNNLNDTHNENIKQKENRKTNFSDNINININSHNTKYKEVVAHHRHSYDPSFNNNNNSDSNSSNINRSANTPINNNSNNNKKLLNKSNYHNSNNNINTNNITTSGGSSSNSKKTSNPTIPTTTTQPTTYNTSSSNNTNFNNISTNTGASFSNNNTTNSKLSSKHTETYDDLIKQFEKLKSKAEFFADKDPAFTSRLINFAKKFSQTSNQSASSNKSTNNSTNQKSNNSLNNNSTNTNSDSSKMDSSGYYSTNFSHGNFSQPSIYSPHSSYHPSNIYSTFSSNIFFNPNHHHAKYQAHPPPPSPPSNPPPPPPPRPPPIPPHTNRTYNSNRYSDTSSSRSHYRYDQSYNKYTYNSQYGHTRHSTNATPQPNFQNIYSQYYQHFPQSEKNSYSYSYSYNNQEGPEDILLILEDPFESNKITVQMTRTQMGPNGEQQRVTVERDFRNESELNKFLKDFEQNLNKSPPNKHHSNTKTSTSSPFKSRSHDDLITPGVVVVEEPGEEPKLYRQDTGELVSDMYVDPILIGENNEHPDELPKGKENAKYAPTNPSKMYKDIDELIERLKNDNVEHKKAKTNDEPIHHGHHTHQSSTETNTTSSTYRHHHHHHSHANTPNVTAHKQVHSEHENKSKEDKENNKKASTEATNVKATNLGENLSEKVKKTHSDSIKSNEPPAKTISSSTKETKINKNHVPRAASPQLPNVSVSPPPSVIHTKKTEPVVTKPSLITTPITALNNPNKLLSEFKVDKNLIGETYSSRETSNSKATTTSSSTRKSETITISRTSLLTNKGNKDLLVAGKTRHRSSSIKSNNRKIRRQDTFTRLNRSPEKLLNQPGVKKIVIHSKNLLNENSKPTPTTNANISTNVQPNTSSNIIPSSKFSTVTVNENLTGIITRENKDKIKQRLANVRQSVTEELLAAPIPTNVSSYNGARVSFQPSTQFSRQFKNVAHHKMGDESVKRPGSLYQKGYLPRSESVLQYDRVRNEAETSIRNYIEEKKKISPLTKNSTIDSNLNQVKARKNQRERKTTIEVAKNRYSQVYGRYESDSDGSTIAELKTIKSFRKDDLSITQLKPNDLRRHKNSLSNLHRNISKSVDTGLSDDKLMKAKAEFKSLVKSNLASNLKQNVNKGNSKKLDLGESKKLDNRKISIQEKPKKVDDKNQKSNESSKKKNVNDKSRNYANNKKKNFSEEDEDEDVVEDDDEENEDSENSVKESSNQDEEDDNEDEEEEDDIKKYFNDDKNSKVNYEFFNYDFSENKTDKSDNKIYSDFNQFYRNQQSCYYRATQPSPAVFQPSFFPRSATRSRMTPQPDASLPQHQHHQHNHHQTCQHQHTSYLSRQAGYYASWYGSAPSLRMPTRQHNRQSLYLN